MFSSDVIVFVVIMILTSALGIWKGKSNAVQKRTSGEMLLGSNVSTISVALSVCSSFLSAVSIVGFPSEVYFRGTMILWFLPMYLFAFPVVAFVFLPPIYELKLTSLYEYLEHRFTFFNRIIASLLFFVQTLFYMAVALYAPALTLSSSLPIPLSVSIFLTALLSAIYLFLGGARAGIYTSALQMLLILSSLFIIICASLINLTPYEIIEKNQEGGRFVFTDFRIDPTIRHSFFPVFFGGCTTIFSLFATNQLTMQRYMSLPTLKKAQRVLLLNVPMNATILIMYVLIGVIIFAAYFDCHPSLTKKDEIFPTFIKDMLYVIPGLEGLFLAAIYAAGLSTLTASYSALTAVTIEDIVKITLKNAFNGTRQLSDDIACKLVKILPFVFAGCAICGAIAICYIDTMILQIAFSIFGAAGGASLGIFVVGLFCPWITSNKAAVVSQLSAIFGTFSVVFGSLYFHVKPVDLPVNRGCDEYYFEFNNSAPFNFSAPNAGTVIADTNDTFLSQISQISYHYYGLLAVGICLVVAHVGQVLDMITGTSKLKPVDKRLVASWVQRFASSTDAVENPVNIPLLADINSEKEAFKMDKEM